VPDTTPGRTPDLPIFLWESGDLHVFATVGEAEGALEPVDVRDGLYTGFDAAGRLLSLGVGVHRERYLGLFRVQRERVEITLAEEIPAHRAEFESILTQFLSATGIGPAILSGMSHEGLVSEAARVSRAIR